MIPHPARPPSTGSLLEWLTVLDLVELAAPPPHRGRPCCYPERLFVKVALVMVVRQVPSVSGVLALLEEPAMAAVRAAVAAGWDGPWPSRRTCERRLRRVSGRLAAHVAALGAQLLALLQPWVHGARALAVDSTPLRARGRVWHQRERRTGVVPHTRIDTEAHWTHSGWHGWVYGYKLHVVATVSPTVWLPLAAQVTPANQADNVQARALLGDLTPAGPALEGVYVLADSAYDDPQLRAQAAQVGWTLVASRRGPRPHTDAGAAVRRVFHALRSQTSEGWNAQYKGVFACREHLPTRGLVATTRFLLGALLVYQLTLLQRWLLGASLRKGLTAAIRAA